MSEQFTAQDRLPDGAVKGWRARVQPIIDNLQRELGRRGLEPSYAPDMPPLNDGVEGFIKQPYRVLMTWIPSWVPSDDAGYHVVRVDTIAAVRK